MIQIDDSYQMIQNKKLERSERVGEWCKSKLNPVKNQFKQNFVNLEIGCGHGHWLSSFALDCDSEVFIGIDFIRLNCSIKIVIPGIGIGVLNQNSVVLT